MTKIGIIGSGRIGSHIAESLLSNKDIAEIQMANRGVEHLLGRISSLKLRGHFSGSKVKIKELDWSTIDELALIVIAIKDQYDPREIVKQSEFPKWIPRNLRYCGLIYDLPLIKEVCEKMSSYAGKVAIVSNPLEIITYFVNKWLPDALVLGLGASVDSARISYFVKKNLGIEICKNQCVVAGEHGAHLIPVSGLWDNRCDRFSSSQVVDQIDQAIAIGFEIVRNLGFTLQDCLPILMDDINWILNKKDECIFRSFAIANSEGCCSKPVKLSKHRRSEEYSDFTLDEKIILNEIETEIANFVRLTETNGFV